MIPCWRNAWDMSYPLICEEKPMLVENLKSMYWVFISFNGHQLCDNFHLMLVCVCPFGYIYNVKTWESNWEFNGAKSSVEKKCMLMTVIANLSQILTDSNFLNCYLASSWQWKQSQDKLMVSTISHHNLPFDSSFHGLVLQRKYSFYM